MPAMPRRYLIVVARRLPAAVVCHRYLIVVPRPLPAALFLVRCGCETNPIDILACGYASILKTQLHLKNCESIVKSVQHRI
jgi:hypothetical protein